MRAFLILLLLASCAAPLLTSEQMVAQLRIGETTRARAVTLLGQPDRTTNEISRSLLEYSWAGNLDGATGVTATDTVAVAPAERIRHKLRLSFDQYGVLSHMHRTTQHLQAGYVESVPSP